MHSASVTLWPPLCHCPNNPSFISESSLNLKPSSLPFPRRRNSFRKLSSFAAVRPTNNWDSSDLPGQCRDSGQYPPRSYSVLDDFRASIGFNGFAYENPQDHIEEPDEGREEIGELEVRGHRGIFTNMWWPDFRAAFGQRINVEGIVFAARVLFKDRNLAIPHVSVPDIRHIDWVELRRRGFKGVVFDKDNTITVPYSLSLWGPLRSSMKQCKSVFGDEIAVFSNSAGLLEYDYDGSKAMALERAIGIKVIRHRVKKPAGTAEEIEKHFGCTSSQLIMVGDRPFTDIVYGNKNGFLTILTKPLSTAEEPFIVRQVRKLEMAILNYWLRKELKPTSHSLLPDPVQCRKENLSDS
ncbi:Phosphatidylglycerophosphate phosphatase 1, chloroplastic/mitochondrial [Linum perenne]